MFAGHKRQVVKIDKKDALMYKERVKEFDQIFAKEQEKFQSSD